MAQEPASGTFAMALWRCGHYIRLMSRRLGFETCQGLRFFGKTLQRCCVSLTYMHCVCVKMRNM
jgi:hypothetical protein